MVGNTASLGLKHYECRRECAANLAPVHGGCTLPETSSDDRRSYAHDHGSEVLRSTAREEKQAVKAITSARLARVA